MNKAMMGGVVCGLLAGIGGATGGAWGAVTPVNAYRSLSASRYLQAPGQDAQQFSQWEHPGTPSRWSNASQLVMVASDAGSIEQESAAVQSAELAQGEKVIDAWLGMHVDAGQWPRGLNAVGQVGALSYLSLTVHVPSTTRVQMSAYAYGTVVSSATLTADIGLSRDGQQVFSWSQTPTYGDFAGGFSDYFTLTPGNWEFSANINGTARSGPESGQRRYGELMLSLSVFEVAIPNVSGACVLALAGIGAGLKRRRA